VQSISPRNLYVMSPESLTLSPVNSVYSADIRPYEEAVVTSLNTQLTNVVICSVYHLNNLNILAVDVIAFMH